MVYAILILEKEWLNFSFQSLVSVLTSGCIVLYESHIGSMIIHRRCLLPPCCGLDTIPEECEETDPAQSVGVNEDLTCNTEKAPLEGDIVNCFDNTGINYQGEHSDPGCIDWKEAENVYFKPEFYPELKSNFCRNPGKEGHCETPKPTRKF